MGTDMIKFRDFAKGQLGRSAILAVSSLAICGVIAGLPARAADVPTVAAYALISDFGTGRVLLEKQADTPMKPASMAKIMTLYIVFERIKEGSLSLEDTFLVSEKAWRKGGSRSFLNVGSRVTVNDLLHGVAVQSGNDAAIVLAEGLGGSEESFAAQMNDTALRLGMRNTNFTNSTGWPDPDLTTTARDLSILASALIRDFPIEEYPGLYPVFAKMDYRINGIKQGNRNPLLYGVPGADGLKTGHTEESGYGLVGSAIRGDQRVIMVLNGMSSRQQRADESRRLMDYMFREYRLYQLFAENEPAATANIWLGRKARLPLVLEQPLERVLSRTERARMKVTVSWQDPVPAPITKGDKIGTLTFKTDGISETHDLLAGESVEQLGMFERVRAAVKYLIFGAAQPLEN